MNKTVKLGTLIGFGFLMLGAPLALANDRSGVSWSVTIGSPYPPQVIYSPPPVVYVPAQPVYGSPYPAYVQPHPTYIQPRPRYIQPYPVYVVPQPIYVQPAPVVRFGGGYHNRDHHPHHAGRERRHFHSHGHSYGRN